MRFHTTPTSAAKGVQNNRTAESHSAEPESAFRVSTRHHQQTGPQRSRRSFEAAPETGHAPRPPPQGRGPGTHRAGHRGQTAPARPRTPQQRDGGGPASSPPRRQPGRCSSPAGEAAAGPAQHGRARTPATGRGGGAASRQGGPGVGGGEAAGQRPPQGAGAAAPAPPPPRAISPPRPLPAGPLPAPPRRGAARPPRPPTRHSPEGARRPVRAVTSGA